MMSSYSSLTKQRCWLKCRERWEMWYELWGRPAETKVNICPRATCHRMSTHSVLPTCMHSHTHTFTVRCGEAPSESVHLYLTVLFCLFLLAKKLTSPNFACHVACHVSRCKIWFKMNDRPVFHLLPEKHIWISELKMLWTQIWRRQII